jgi:hypothetical protein
MGNMMMMMMMMMMMAVSQAACNESATRLPLL